MESDIIIVNHHLFFADLAIKQQAEDAPDAGILPEVGAVIFDEAHELEDVAGVILGFRSAMRGWKNFAGTWNFAAKKSFTVSVVVWAVKSLREKAMFFFALLPQGAGDLHWRIAVNFWKKTAKSF